MFNIALFISTFIIVVNRSQIITFLGLIVGLKTKTSTLKDKWISRIVKQKSGLTIEEVTLFHDEKMYAMMVGFPFWPKMIISTGLYKQFSKDELEWVILHEAGHCVLWHNLQAAVLQILAMVLGSYMIWNLKIGFFGATLIVFLFGFICIQSIRWGIEYFADWYSISRVNNPKGVITAQQKFRKNYKGSFQNENSVLRFLFHWNITPGRRIIMANRRLSGN